MGAFKDNYLKEKELIEKELKDEYINDLVERGYVLEDEDLETDFEYLDEDDGSCTECVYTDIDIEDDGDVNERLYKKIVVRNGKKIKKWKTTDPRKKVVPDPAGGKPKEVVKKASERIKRKKGQLKGKIKRKVKGAQMKLKRKLSQRKRKMFGIK